MVRPIRETFRGGGVAGNSLAIHRRRAAGRIVLALVIGVIHLSGGLAYGQAPRGPLANWWQNGCKVGPNYARPAAPVAPELRLPDVLAL